MRDYSKEQRSTLLVAVITSFITTFMGSALNLSIPAMGSEFKVSAAAIGWVITAYMLVCAAAAVPFGRAADMTSRKKILVTGIFTFAAASLAATFSLGFAMMMILRVLQGIGASMIFATKDAVLISLFPGTERGRVLGLSVASTYMGLAAGPVIGGIVNHYMGWRAIFVITFAISVFSGIIAVRKLTDSRAESISKSLDIWGNLLFIGMIVLTMYGISALSTLSWSAALVITGVILGVIFVRHELKVAEPVIKVSMFKSNLAYTFSNLAALLNYAATFAITYLLSIYLQVVMGYSSQAAGIVLITSPVVMAILSPYMGRLSDRIAPYKLATTGMALCAAALFIYSFLDERFSLWAIIGTLVISGIGFGTFSSPNTNAVMECVEKEDYGVATSILATMRSIGHTLSMAIVTLVVSAYMGSTPLAQAEPAALIRTMHMLFLIFTGMCVVGTFISLKRKKK